MYEGSNGGGGNAINGLTANSNPNPKGKMEWVGQVRTTRWILKWGGGEFARMSRHHTHSSLYFTTHIDIFFLYNNIYMTVISRDLSTLSFLFFAYFSFNFLFTCLFLCFTSFFFLLCVYFLTVFRVDLSRWSIRFYGYRHLDLFVFF